MKVIIIIIIELSLYNAKFVLLCACFGKMFRSCWYDVKPMKKSMLCLIDVISDFLWIQLWRVCNRVRRRFNSSPVCVWLFALGTEVDCSPECCCCYVCGNGWLEKWWCDFTSKKIKNKKNYNFDCKLFVAIFCSPFVHNRYKEIKIVYIKMVRRKGLLISFWNSCVRKLKIEKFQNLILFVKNDCDPSISKGAYKNFVPN
jgi:hypothetical protein